MLQKYSQALEQMQIKVKELASDIENSKIIRGNIHSHSISKKSCR